MSDKIIPSFASIEKRPNVNISKLKPGQEVLMETHADTIISLKVIDPEKRIVEMTGTERYFKNPATPRKGIFLAAWLSPDAEVVWEDRIVKDMHFAVKLKDGTFVTNMIVAARLIDPKYTFDIF